MSSLLSEGEGGCAPTTGNQATQPSPTFPASKSHGKTICEIMISPEHSTGWGRTFPVSPWDVEGMDQQWEGHGLHGEQLGHAQLF